MASIIAERPAVSSNAIGGRRLLASIGSLMDSEKYAEKFAGKYRQRCLQLRRDLHEHVYLYLNGDLYLDLSSMLYAELNREKFEKSFLKKLQKLFAMLFGKLFDLKYLWL
jgi:hypothetical protein